MHRNQDTAPGSPPPRIADLLHGEYTNQTNIAHTLKPVLDAATQSLRQRAARLLVEERYLDGEQVTMHCHVVDEGRLAGQVVFSVPISLIDTPNDEDLVAHFRANALVAHYN